MLRLSTRTVAGAAVFTALTAAVTAGFTVAIPATNGYFDVGEILVYTVALIMGPYVGAFSGGVGSAISDAIFAPQYAPGTLVVKGLEGFIVGYLGTKIFVKENRSTWRLVVLGLAALLGALVAVLGVYFLTGIYNLIIGLSEGNPTGIGPQTVVIFSIPAIAAIILAVIVFASVAYAGWRSDARLGWTMISILLGGGEMVTGYFVYEAFVLNLGVYSASGEVPFNIAQVVIGLLVGLPLVIAIRRVTARTPVLKSAG